MAGHTPRFGLNYFGGGQPGSITDEGQKFTAQDPLTVDRQLRILEGHDYLHRPAAPAVMETPPTALTVEGGLLRGGQTVYYRISLVDDRGSETAAGPELAVTLPALLNPPLPLALDMNEQEAPPTGTLPPGFYQYALTALRGDEETTLGPVLPVTVPNGTTAVQFALPAYGEADALRLWRLGDSDAGFTKIAVIPVGTTTFVDDGSVVADPCACDPENLPPQFNIGATYAVEITLPAAVVVETGWRLYRSTISGSYPASSLVHQVVELNNEDDLGSGILRSWVDLGEQLTLGAPRDGALDARPRAFAFDTGPTLPNPAGYPAMYPFVHQGTLYVLTNGAWVAVSGGGGGGGGGVAPIQTSPNGKRWIQTVDDTGAIVMVETTFPGPPAPVQNVTVA